MRSEIHRVRAADCVSVGDDWAEAHHDVCLMDEGGTRLAVWRLPEGLAGVAVFHEMVAEHTSNALFVEVSGHRGELHGYGFDTWPYVPVEAAQAPVAALGLQQRCPYPPLPQMGERGVAQLVQRPTRRVAEQRPGLLIRQPTPTGVRTEIRESRRLVGSAVSDEHRTPLPAAQMSGAAGGRFPKPTPLLGGGLLCPSPQPSEPPRRGPRR